MNIKRMETMLSDLNENFDRHLSESIQNYFYVLPVEDGEGYLKLRMYSQGGDVELELLALSPEDKEAEFSIKVDGEVADTRLGVITIAPLTLTRGWRVVEITGRDVTAGRVRMSGNVSSVSVLA